MQSPSVCPDMASEDETDFSEAVVTCEGNLHDPDFSTKFQLIVDKLKILLYKSKKEEAFKIRKIEPWNSVRVTISIPKDAAQRLRTLAQQGNQVLRQLGILSVQVEGDQVISLTLAGKNNEPQEVVLTQSDGSGPSCSLTSSLSIPSASSFLSSLVPNSQNAPNRLSQVSSPSSPHPSQHQQQSSLVAPTLQSPGHGGLSFVSPNVIAPGGEHIPSLPKTGAVSTPRPLHGPFSFSSMTHAVHTLQRSDSSTLSTSSSSGGKSPIPSSSPSYSSCQSAGTSSNNLTSTNRAPPVLQGFPQTVLVTRSDQTRFISSSSGTAGVNAHSNLNLVNSGGQNQNPTSTSSSSSSTPTSQSLQIQFVEAAQPLPNPPPYPHQSQQLIQFRLPQGQFQQPNNNSSGVIANVLPSDKPISSPLLVNLLQYGDGGSPTSPATPSTPRPPSTQGQSTAEDARTSMPPPPLSISLTLENPKVKRYQLLQQQRKIKRGMSLDMQGSPISPDMTPAPHQSPTSISEPASPVSSPMTNEGAFNQLPSSDSQLMPNSSNSMSGNFSDTDQGQVRQLTLYQQGGNFRIVNQAQMMSQQQQQQQAEYQGQGGRFSQNQLPVSQSQLHAQKQQSQNQLVQQQQQRVDFQGQQVPQAATHVNGSVPQGALQQQQQQQQRYQFFQGQDNTMRMNQGYAVQIQRPQTPSPQQMQGIPQLQGGIQQQIYSQQQQQQQQVTYQTNAPSQQQHQQQQQFLQMHNPELQQMKRQGQEFFQTGMQSHQGFSQQNQQQFCQNPQNQQNSAQAQRNPQFNNQQQQQQAMVQQNSQFHSQSSQQHLQAQNPQNPGVPLQQRQMVIQNYQQQRTQFVMQNSQVSNQSQGQTNSQFSIQNQQSQVQTQQNSAQSQQNFMLQQQFLHQRQQQQQQIVLQQNPQHLQQQQQQQSNNQPSVSGVTTLDANRMMVPGQGQSGQFRNFIPTSSAPLNLPDRLQQQQQFPPPPSPQQVPPSQSPTMSSPSMVPVQTGATFITPSAPPPRLISTMYRAILSSQTDDDESTMSKASQHGGKKIRRTAKPHPSGGKPKLLLNPLTGHLEPIPGADRGSSSESEEDEEDGRKGKGKGPRGKSINRPKGKDPPISGAAGGKPLSALGKPGAFDSARARFIGATTLPSPQVTGSMGTSAGLAEPITSDSSVTGEKIKLRLKLEKNEPAYKVDVPYVKKAEKSTSSFPGFPEGGNECFGNSSSPVEQPRVPPLHISLRGKNSAVVVSPRRDEPSGNVGTYNPNIPPPPLTPKPGSNYPVVSTNNVDFTALFPQTTVAEQAMNFKPAKGKKGSKASRPKINNKESSSNPPLPTTPSASCIPGKIRSKSKSTTSMPVGWKIPNLDSQSDSAEIGLESGKGATPAGKPKPKNTRRKSENPIAKGGFELVPMSRSDISAHVRQFLPEFAPKIPTVKAAPPDHHSSVIVGTVSIPDPKLPQLQTSAPSLSETEMEVDRIVPKAQPPMDDFKVSIDPSYSKSDVFREAFVRHNNTMPIILKENDQLTGCALEPMKVLSDEKPVKHTIRPIPDLLALTSKSVTNITGLLQAKPEESPTVTALSRVSGESGILHPKSAVYAQDKIVQELLGIPSPPPVLEIGKEAETPPPVASRATSEEVLEGSQERLNDEMMEKMDGSEVPAIPGDLYVENVSLFTLPIIPSSEQTGNGNGAAGEDSGIDSMDALSEKSPNQGESPARKESENNFLPTSEQEDNLQALEPVMEQPMDMELELQSLSHHSPPPPVEEVPVQVTNEEIGGMQREIIIPEKEKLETEDITKEIPNPLKCCSTEAAPEDLDLEDVTVSGNTLQVSQLNVGPSDGLAVAESIIDNVNVTGLLPHLVEPDAIPDSRDLQQIERQETTVSSPVVEDEKEVQGAMLLAAPEVESAKQYATDAIKEIGDDDDVKPLDDLAVNQLETSFQGSISIPDSSFEDPVEVESSDVVTQRVPSSNDILEETILSVPQDLEELESHPDMSTLLPSVESTLAEVEVVIEKAELEVPEDVAEEPAAVLDATLLAELDSIPPSIAAEETLPNLDEVSVVEPDTFADNLEPGHFSSTPDVEVNPEVTLEVIEVKSSVEEIQTPEVSSVEEIVLDETKPEEVSAMDIHTETLVDDTKLLILEMEIKPKVSVEEMDSEISHEEAQPVPDLEMTTPEELVVKMDSELSTEDLKLVNEDKPETILEEIKSVHFEDEIGTEASEVEIPVEAIVEETIPETLPLPEGKETPENEVEGELLNVESTSCNPDVETHVVPEPEPEPAIHEDPLPVQPISVEESETVVQEETPVVSETEEQTLDVPVVVPVEASEHQEIILSPETVQPSAEGPVDSCELGEMVPPELIGVAKNEIIESPPTDTTDSITPEVQSEKMEVEEQGTTPGNVEAPIVEVVLNLETKKEAAVIVPVPKPKNERQTSSITVNLPDVEILHTTVVSPTSVITHIVAAPAAVVTLPREPVVEEPFVPVKPVLPLPVIISKREAAVSESTKIIVTDTPVKPIGSVHPIQKPKSKFIARRERDPSSKSVIIVPASNSEVTVLHSEIVKTEVSGGQGPIIIEQGVKVTETKKSGSGPVETKKLDTPTPILIEPLPVIDPPKTVIIKADSCGRITKEAQSVSPVRSVEIQGSVPPPTERVVPVSILPRFDQSPQKQPQRFFVQSSSGVLSPLPNLVRPTQPGQPSQGVIRPIPIPPLEFKPIMTVKPAGSGEDLNVSHQVNETPGTSGVGRGRLGLEAIISALGGKTNATEPGIQRYPIPAQPHGNLLNINRFPVNVIQVSSAGLSSPSKHQNIISIPGGAGGSGQTMFTIPAKLSHQFQMNHQAGITVLPSGQKVVPIKLLQLPKGAGTPVVRAGTNQSLQPNRSSPTIIDLSNRSGSPQFISQRVGAPRPIQTTPMNLSNVGGNIKFVPISANHAQLQKVLVSSPIKTGNVVSGNMIQMMMNANSKAATSCQGSQPQQGQGQPTTIRVVRPGGGFVDLRREPTTGALTMSQQSLEQLQSEGALKPLPMSFSVSPQATPVANLPISSVVQQQLPQQPILIPKEVPTPTPSAEANPPEAGNDTEDTENETEEEENGLEDEEFGYEGDIIHDEQDVAVALASTQDYHSDHSIMQNGIDTHEDDNMAVKENCIGPSHSRPSGVSHFTSLAHETTDFSSGGDTGDIHGEDQEIIDSFSGQVSSPEDDHPDSEQGQPETDHTYVGKQRNGRSERKSPPKVNMAELSIEIPATDLNHPDFVEESGSGGDDERKQPMATRSTRSNTRIVSVSPDITALTTSRSDTPKLAPPVAKINNTRELRNSPKPSPTGGRKLQSPSTFSPGLNAVSNCHGTGGSSSPVSTHLLKATAAAMKNKRKRRGSDSSSASKDENGDEGQQKVELIDLNARPGKRRCSENAAELIKACIGLEDTPKRNTMLIKRLEDAKAKEKSKKATLSLVEEIDSELGSVDFGRGGRSSRGSSEDRSSSRGSSVNRHPLPPKAQQKEEEKETKRNARPNHRNTNTATKRRKPNVITETPNKVHHETEIKKGKGKPVQKSKQNAKESLVMSTTSGKGRGGNVKKENVTGNDKSSSTPTVSPEIENPRRKTRSSAMTGGFVDSDGPGGKRRRIGKD